MNILNRDIKKIAVLRALFLGDLLCAVPAFRALRAAFPQSTIDLIGLPWALSFVDRYHKYLDGLVPFAGYPDLPEQEFEKEKYEAFVNRMEEEKYDLIIQMHGNGTIVNDLVKDWGGSMIAGYFYHEPPEGYTTTFMKYPEMGTEVERHLQLLSFLGVPSQGTEIDFPFLEEDYISFHKLPIDPNQKYVVVHPGSRSPLRRWRPEYFAQVADYCIREGYQVAITGTSSELPIVEEVIRYTQHKLINLAGKTSLGSVALLIKHASLLVSNCTGVSHIAAAMHTPSVVVSMDGEPERWSPINKKLHHLIDWKTYPSFEKVMKQVKQMLRTTEKQNHYIT